MMTQIWVYWIYVGYFEVIRDDGEVNFVPISQSDRIIASIIKERMVVYLSN